MSAFMQRLKHSFQRSSRQETANTGSPTHEDKRKQRADDYDVEDYYDEHPRRNSSSPPLPVIIDSGPPTAHRYENEDIFWNSTMIEAERDPMALPKNKNQKPSGRFAATLDMHYVGGLGLPSIREEIRHSPRGVRRSDVTVMRSPEVRKDPEQGEFLEKDGAGNNLTAIRAPLPARTSRPSTPLVQQDRLDEPIAPGTEEWDLFMDFPTENSTHKFGSLDENVHAVSTAHASAAPTSMATATAKFAVVQEATMPPSPIQEVDEMESQANPQLVHTRPRDIILAENQVLMWNSVLNQIMDNPYVEPSMKEAVRDRIRESTWTNGNGEGEETVVSAIGAGLVPNFSYPMVGSSFYDRIAAERMQLESLQEMNHGEGETDIEKQGQRRFITDVRPNSSVSFSSSSREGVDSLLRYRPPEPVLDPANHVYMLLCSILSPSEISLHHHMLNNVIPHGYPPFPETTSESNASSSVPRPERLVRNLDFIILGLQDRINHLEETLIPKLSHWLERKTVTVDELTVEVLNKQAENADLKLTMDYSSRVLRGCFDREWEVWRTLAVIKAKRTRPGSTLFRRLTRRSPPASSNENSPESGIRVPGYRWEVFSGELDPLRPSNTPPRFGDQAGSSIEQRQTAKSATPTTGSGDKPLSKRELEALILMAAQNVRILREDTSDMVAMIQEIKRKGEVIQEVEPEPGSWRDV